MNPLLDALLKSAHDPMWIVNGDATLVAWNGPFVRLCADGGTPPPEAGAAVPAIFGSASGELLRRALGGRPVSMSTSLLTRGVTRTFELSGTPVIEDRTVTAAVFTARELATADRSDREDLFELSLTRLFLAGDHPLEQTLQAALEYLCESDGWDCGVLWLLERGDTTALRPVAIHASPDLKHGDALQSQLASVTFRRGHGLPGRAWADDDILWIADLADESHISRAHLADRLGLHAAVAVPLRDSGRIAGVVELFTRAVRPLDDHHARALLHAGAGLGRLIERRRAEDERRHLLQVIERKGLEWTLTFDAIELPIFITSMDGTVRRMNRAARDLTGRDYADVVGRRLRFVASGEPWITLAACVEAVRDSGETCTAQAHEAASDRTWDIAANGYAPAEEPARVILIARETTNIVRLQSAVRRGEQLSALGELVAGVAHEVRNPIFGMQITVDALAESLPPSDDVAELLAVLRRWLDRLNRLMESLLAYGRTWNVNLQPGAVGDVVRQARETSDPLARAANVTVNVEAAETSPILMDPARLLHAFENLIANAIQHSDSGSSVDVHVTQRGDVVECVVRDHGGGFDPADLPRIFEPFFTRRRGGTGLGLAIVFRIVEEHGGTIRAGTAANGGAMLTAEFPVYQADK